MLGQSNNKYLLYVAFKCFLKPLRRRTCGLRALTAASYQLQKLLLVKGLIIYYLGMLYLQSKGNDLKMRIFL